MKVYFNPSRKSALPIPCAHPQAQDGFFYCVPSFHDAPRMWDDFAFLLVDMKKVITHLQMLNPELLQHAEYKFRESTSTAETVKSWVELTSFQHPRDMGYWVYNPFKHYLEMSSGQAATIKLVHELNIPCFPIAVPEKQADLIDEQFGYNDRTMLIRPTTFRPTPTF